MNRYCLPDPELVLVAVMHLADEQPTNVTDDQTYYDAEAKCPNCLIGHALVACGVPLWRLAEFDTWTSLAVGSMGYKLGTDGKVPSIAQLYGYPAGDRGTPADVDSLLRVQILQDASYEWGEAIKALDDEPWC